MGKKILVVVDMQKDFTTGALGNNECVAVIDKVKKVIKDGNYDKIIFTMDTHTKDYLNTQEGKFLPVEHCIKGTVGHEIVDKLVDTANMTNAEISYVEKPVFGSFKLADIIAETIPYPSMQKEAIVDFVGVCTGICVISNFMIVKARVPETQIRIIENACACVTPESHNRAIEAMKLCQAVIV